MGHRALFALFVLAGCSSSMPAGSPDAGIDASATNDGGLDAAPVPDAGTGIDAGLDASASPDTGTASDTGLGSDVGSDGGNASDGGTDAGGAVDAGGDAGAATPTHLLLSEVAVGPAAAEFFEIWNPTAAAVSLDDYYVSDNATYYGIAAGSAWSPPTSNPGTDFLFGFPAGTTMAPGAVLVVAVGSGFEPTYSRCPDFVADTVPLTCTSGTAAAVRVPTNGGLDPTHRGTLLSDSREMLVLFRWDGAASIVTDVDYVTWGATFDVGASRVDKTGIAGYAPDTAAATQHPAPAPPTTQSIERCGAESAETSTGGNGLGGHDETSEHLDTAFAVRATPTPSTHTGCL